MGNSRNIGGEVTIKDVIRPRASAAAGTYGVTGATIDRSNFTSMLVEVKTGASAGTPDSFAVDAKLQDSADGSSWADVAASASNPAVAITQITAVNTSRFLEIDLSGLRRYVRMVAQVAFSGGSTPTVGLSASAALKPVVGPPVHA